MRVMEVIQGWWSDVQERVVYVERIEVAFGFGGKDGGRRMWSIWVL